MSNSRLFTKTSSQGEDRSVILTVTHLGFSNSTTIGCFDALRSGLATSSRLVIPGPWSRGAGSSYRGDDVGIDLVVSSEHPIFVMAPITYSPSLVAGLGGFAGSYEDFWEHADIDETRREVRAQIERSIIWGFDLSHIACWNDAMIGRPEFFDILVDLALEFKLPLKITKEQCEAKLGFPAYALAVDAGVTVIDHSIDLWSGSWARIANPEEALEEAASHLVEGVNEISFRVAPDTRELRALMSDWPRYVSFHGVINRVTQIRSMFDKLGIRVIGYRELRDNSRPH